MSFINNNNIRLGVLTGGNGNERQISLHSAQAVSHALDNIKIPHTTLDLRNNYVQQIIDSSINHAFLCIHGSYGENGQLQAVLDSLNIKYTGSNMHASSLAINKWHSYLVWTAQGIPTPKCVLLNDSSNFDSISTLTYPLAIKPTCEGSSIGISKVSNKTEVLPAYQTATKYTSQVIAQEWIEGRELAVGIIQNQTLPIVEIKTNREFYDYDAKYKDNTTQYLHNIGLNPKIESKIFKIAKQAFHALGCTQYGRVDLILHNEDIYVIEVNTIPGMTKSSLIPIAASLNNISFEKVVMQILNA